MTVAQAVAEAVARLEQAGIADPRRETDELYAAVVCGATSTAFLDSSKDIAPAVLERLQLAVERRAAGWPQPYAAGRANFRGHWLTVDQRVLIPRPETEGLVELVIGWLRQPRRRFGRSGLPVQEQLVLRRSDAPPLPLAADIGTGSGAIAIALALEAAVSGVIATDISADALNVALDNALSLGAKERISFRRGDLLGALLDDKVDVLVSNPPYVATAEWERLDASVKDFEPRLALDGGADGLDPYRALIRQAAEALTPGGLLALEVDANRAGQAAALASDAGFVAVRVLDDLFGRQRYLLAERPA